jgi:hypothetical protein
MMSQAARREPDVPLFLCGSLSTRSRAVERRSFGSLPMSCPDDPPLEIREISLQHSSTHPRLPCPDLCGRSARHRRAGNRPWRDRSCRPGNVTIPNAPVFKVLGSLFWLRNALKNMIIRSLDHARARRDITVPTGQCDTSAKS